MDELITALKAEITELKRSRDSFSGMWKRAALENTTLEDENAALIANAVDAMGGFTDEPLTAEEFLAILKRKWQERDTWEEQAGKRLAALTAQVEHIKQEAEIARSALDAQVERLTAPVRSIDTMRMLQEARIHGLQTILTKWLAARATAPATGAEQVHAPKTIVPEPDQRRIETERFPQKGQDNG